MARERGPSAVAVAADLSGSDEVRRLARESQEALGKFSDLLLVTAHHPAMLFYLDNWMSTRADFVPGAGPAEGRQLGLNENYAREIMELHTLDEPLYQQQPPTAIPTWPRRGSTRARC